MCEGCCLRDGVDLCFTETLVIQYSLVVACCKSRYWSVEIIGLEHVIFYRMEAVHPIIQL